MENMNFCQSCGMPMQKPEDFGTEKNGQKNQEYCTYCFQDGKFVADITMEEMIEGCVAPMLEAHPEMKAEDVRKQMKEFFPTLKRWK